MVDKIFTPWKLGGIELANRVVMAPMTRNRADDDGVLPASAVEYYRQRAGAGLIVTEGTQPSAAGKGYPGTPGMHSDEQQAAWADIATAVHAAGGRIFCQLMHTGRIGHETLLPAGGEVVAPSAVAANLEVATATGEMLPAVEPRAMTVEEIAQVVEDFASAAERAVAAGLDGVELHGANGYLLHQFLCPSTNLRTDQYGGSPQNRARFVVEVVRAVAARIGAERIGLRLSPGGQFNDMSDRGNEDTYLALVDELEGEGMGYLHTLRGRTSTLHVELRKRWTSTYIMNTGYMGSSDLEVLAPFVESGETDLVSVGRWFISNPDLVDRWRTGADLTPWDEDTFFTAGDRGYTDYPSVSDAPERTHHG